MTPDVRPDKENRPDEGSFTVALPLSVAIVAMATIALGYDEGVMSGAGDPIVDAFQLDSWQKGAMMGSLNLVAAPSAILGSWFADRYGRVRGTAGTAVLLILGPIIVCTSGSFAVLMSGRVVTGIGVGLAFVIPPLYAAELAPPRFRGRMVTVMEILINAGIVLGYVSAMFLEMLSSWGWRLVTGLAAAPPLLVLCSTPWLPESPRWLAKQRHWDAVKQVLQQLWEGADNVNHMESSIARALEDEDQEASWSTVLFPSPTVRRMLLAGLGVAFFQQACGSEAIVYYSPTILDKYGVTDPQSQNHYTVFVGLAKLTGAIIGGTFLDLVGRRPGLIASCMGSAICLGTLAISLTSQTPMIGEASLVAFMIFFELGLAPAAFVLGTESYPTAIRAKALSMGMFTTRLLSGLVSTTFPGVASLITMQATLALFGIVALVGALWATACVPETRGLSLEEAAKLFEGQSSSWPLVSSAASKPDDNVAYGAVST